MISANPKVYNLIFNGATTATVNYSSLVGPDDTFAKI